MSISYTNDLPGKKAFFELFETTGWNEEYRLNEDELYTALQNSWYTVSAWDGDRLAGLGRLISDGTCHALILDMIVLPAYQGRGIGGAILENILSKCREHNLRDIQLFCAKGKIGFYEKYGFKPRPDDAPGMDYKNE